MHLVRDTVAMLRGSKSGGVEIGELTSISSPGRPVGWLRRVRSVVILSPPWEQSPFSHLLSFLQRLPPTVWTVRLFEPLPRGEPASHQEHGERLSILGDPRKSPSGGRPGAYYTTAIYCVPISRGRAFLAGTATANIWPDKVRLAFGDIYETLRIRTGHRLCR